jgi:hypothetical protein
MGFAAIFRCIEFGWVKGGRRKMNEVAPGVPQDPEEAKALREEGPLRKLARTVIDTQELTWNTRGIGYDFGTGNGLRLPKVVKLEHNRFAWLVETVRDIVRRYIWVDIVTSFVKLQPWVPGVGTSTGGR